MTTPKKAPTASERALDGLDALHAWACNIRSMSYLDSDSRQDVCPHEIPDRIRVIRRSVVSALASARSAAAQEPGDSVEGLHPWYGPCDALGSDGVCSECQCVAGGQLSPFARTHIFRPYREELARQRAALTPAAPDASWLDTATFEELEEWLPDDLEILSGIRSSVSGFWVRRTFEAQFSGVFATTRTEAVRAYLKANPELWKDRR